MCQFDSLSEDNFVRSGLLDFRVLAVVRGGIAIALLGVLVSSAVFDFEHGAYFLYFTTWSLIIQTAYFIVRTTQYDHHLGRVGVLTALLGLVDCVHPWHRVHPHDHVPRRLQLHKRLPSNWRSESAQVVVSAAVALV
jgi:hypothetical protein